MAKSKNQLQEYIKTQISKGYTPEAIKKHLLSVGWKEKDINPLIKEATHNIHYIPFLMIISIISIFLIFVFFRALTSPVFEPTIPEVFLHSQIAEEQNKSVQMPSGRGNEITKTANNQVSQTSNKETVSTVPIAPRFNAPSHSTPILNATSAYNFTTDNLTCYNQSSSGTTSNIYNWFKDNSPLMVLNMPFDSDDSGGTNTTKDYSSLGNDGQLGSSANNDAAEPTWTSSGKIGGAYSFDGSNDYIKILNINGTALDIDKLTIEAWVYLPEKYDSSRTDNMMVVQAPGQYCFWFHQTDGRLRIADDRGEYLDSNKNTWSAGWYHIVGILDDANNIKKIYINGELDNSDTSAFGIDKHCNNWNCDLFIGARNGNPSLDDNPDSFWFKGKIDNVRIYNRTLSASQAYQRYLDTKDGHSSNETIVSDETSTGDIWMCQVTPNDGTDDGTTLNSTSVTIHSPDINISLISPTPANSSKTYNSTITVNASVSHDLFDIDECILQCNSSGSIVNYTMTKVGSGKSVTCYYSNNNISDGKQIITIYANTTNGYQNSKVREFYAYPSYVFYDDFDDGNISDWTRDVAGNNRAAGLISSTYVSAPYGVRTYAEDEQDEAMLISPTYDLDVNNTNYNVSLRVYTSNYRSGVDKHKDMRIFHNAQIDLRVSSNTNTNKCYFKCGSTTLFTTSNTEQWHNFTFEVFPSQENYSVYHNGVYKGTCQFHTYDSNYANKFYIGDPSTTAIFGDLRFDDFQITSSVSTSISFVSPTPPDNHDLYGTSNITVNISASNPSNDIDTCIIEWTENGQSPVNYTMTKVGSGKSVICHHTYSLPNSATYTYKVYVKDSSGIWTVSENRTVVKNKDYAHKDNFDDGYLGDWTINVAGNNRAAGLISSTYVSAPYGVRTYAEDEQDEAMLISPTYDLDVNNTNYNVSLRVYTSNYRSGVSKHKDMRIFHNAQIDLRVSSNTNTNKCYFKCGSTTLFTTSNTEQWHNFTFEVFPGTGKQYYKVYHNGVYKGTCQFHTYDSNYANKFYIGDPSTTAIFGDLRFDDIVIKSKSKNIIIPLSGYSFTTVSDGTDATTPQIGRKDVYIKDNSNKIIGVLDIDFDSKNISLSGITAETNIGNGKAVLHMSNWPDEVKNKDIYVPKLAGDTAAFVCPTAVSLSDITPTCPNKIYSGYYSKNIGGQDYWVFENVSGTGGQSGMTSNLTIYDEYEGSSASPNTSITFYANYTNISSGAHISGASCNITFDDNWGTWYQMTDNGNNYNYTKSSGFSTTGTHKWNVTCFKTGYELLDAQDDILIQTIGSVPEFDIFTLPLALFMGLFVIFLRLNMDKKTK